MGTAEKAIMIFREGGNCAQSILSAFENKDYPHKEIYMAMGSGFGSGFGGSNGSCGAVTSAVMVIGLNYLNNTDTVNSKKIVYERVMEFSTAFKEKHDSMQCTELIGVDLGTSTGRSVAKEKSLYAEKCEQFIHSSCKILDNILNG